MQSESSGVKMTRFQIEGWLELMGTPSVDILHRSDCAWLCCLLSQYSNYCKEVLRKKNTFKLIILTLTNQSKFELWPIESRRRILKFWHDKKILLNVALWLFFSIVSKVLKWVMKRQFCVDIKMQLQKECHPIAMDENAIQQNSSRSRVFLREIGCQHGLRTPREEIAFTTRPKIQSQSQIFGTAEAYFVCQFCPIL